MLGLCLGCYAARKVTLRQGRLLEYVPTWLGREPMCLCGCELGVPGRECEEKARVGCEVYKCRAETLVGDWVAWKLDVRSTGSTFAFPFVKRLSLARHVTLPDHGVGLDGQSCSCLIVGWPVGLSSPTLGVGRPSVMFLFDCWPVVRPMLRTVRGCYRGGIITFLEAPRFRSSTFWKNGVSSA
ncbi:hypothetical protein F2Q69_00007259 [Brassica cretica]|uniref:Uncharacterized protein n=1 Tax=Brassica cretica TaxID=69181 RepID=A0A8S9P6U8_BRACR|nr:hypothetical protein F2Q69_00007259 [Brassica cretica]